MGSALLTAIRNADAATILKASVPILWFLTSYPAFAITVQQPPGPRRWLLLPLNLIGPALCFAQVDRLYAGIDWLWGFTSLIYVFHATAGLYIEQWTLPTSTSRSSWNLYASYKAWNNPRRLQVRSPEQQKTVTQKQRGWFVLRKLGQILLLWAVFIGIELGLVFTLFPMPRDFVPRTYFHFHLDRAALMRAVYCLHWAWLTVFLLSVSNGVLAILFVGVLQLDAPDEWPALWGSVWDAYSLRRFWGVFWHKIGSPSQVVHGRFISRRFLGLTEGCNAEKIFLAFFVFTVSGATHIAVNWRTRASAPVKDLFGDMVFLTLNFLGGLLEFASGTLLLRPAREPRPRPENVKEGPDAQQQRQRQRRAGIPWWKRALGFFWVFLFSYCTVPPWQYAYLHADAKARLPQFKLNLDIDRARPKPKLDL